MPTTPDTVEPTPDEVVPSGPATLADGERWYVVHTLPLCEGRAQIQLENQSFRTFLPKRHKTIRHARKLSTVEAAFFPRYLFVALDLTRHQWRSVNGTFGVASLVMRGDQLRAGGRFRRAARRRRSASMRLLPAACPRHRG